jgi:uncharacterized protein with HEPN domain
LTPRDEAVLLDILKACKLTSEFLGEMDRSAFLAVNKTQAAVIHEILVIGEATKRLTADVKDGVTGVPWKAIAGMRDKLIHHYDVVDPEAVWKAASVDVPALLQLLAPLAPKPRD